MLLKHTFAAVLLSAPILTGTAQEVAVPHPDEATEATPEVAAPVKDGFTGFSPQALQEWQSIEQELNRAGENREQQLRALNAALEREYCRETVLIVQALKAQLLEDMLEEVFKTADSHADINKARKLLEELISMNPDETLRAEGMRMLEIQFENPDFLLEQIRQDRAERTSAEAAASDMEEVSAEDEERIEELDDEIEFIPNLTDKLNHLKAQLPRSSRNVKLWLRSRMSELLTEELGRLQAAGINTVDDVMKVKAIFALIIDYCYEEADKPAARRQLEQDFSDPEAIIRMLKLEEESMESPEDAEAEEPEILTA